MIDREDLQNKLTELFLDFCTKVGFSKSHSKSIHPGDTSIYAINNHALCLGIDWRDYYLDIDVVRLVNGAIPKEYSETPDGRLCRIPIRHIYDVEVPTAIDKIGDPNERMMQTISFLIKTVQNNPEKLKEFVLNIDANTTPERTKSYKVKCFQRIIDDLDEDFRIGKLEAKVYQVLRRRAVEQMNSYINRCN